MKSSDRNIVKSHMAQVRRHIAEANAMLQVEDLLRAHAAAEQAQHAAFDLKDYIDSMLKRRYAPSR
jgi:hypothetical protein